MEFQGCISSQRYTLSPLTQFKQEWKTEKEDVMWFTIANIGIFVFSALYMCLSIIKVEGVKCLMSNEDYD